MDSVTLPHTPADSLLHQACEEMRRRVTAGKPCHAESLLAAFPALAADASLAVRLLALEWKLRTEHGERLHLADWLRRFPQWADPLRREIEASGLAVETSPNDARTVVKPPPADPLAVTTAADSAAALTDTLREGVLPPHEILEEIGRGAMGVVYRARDLVLNRPVALKMIGTGVLAGPAEVARFYREARAAAQLQHPHIVQIHAIGHHNGQPAFTMQLATNGSLDVRRERFTEPHAAADLVEKLARAVSAAHAHGIIHRDLKPANILFDHNDQPLVGDFGLARFANSGLDVTRPGQLVGTPAYMAPEQAAGESGRVGASTDVWALGVLLYELLLGRRPFDGCHLNDTIRRIQFVAPERPRALRKSLDRDLEAIILHCLEKDPTERYPSAAALADDLARWQSGEPTLVRPESWPRRAARVLRRHAVLTTTAAVAVAAALALMTLLTPADPDRPLKEKQQTLLRGEPAALVGPTGVPAWKRWVGAEGGVMPSPHRDGVFTVDSQNLALLELLPDPQQHSYRFQAEVRHVQTADRVCGRVGLYFLYSRLETADGPAHLFMDLTFNDKDPPETRVFLRVRRYLDPAGKRAGHFTIEIPLKRNCCTLAPFGPIEDPWRRLAAEVRGNGIKVYWEGEMVCRLDRAAFIQQAVGQDADDALRPEDAATALPPRGGCGLTVFHGVASFRNVVVTPLRD